MWQVANHGESRRPVGNPDADCETDQPKLEGEKGRHLDAPEVGEEALGSPGVDRPEEWPGKKSHGRVVAREEWLEAIGPEMGEVADTECGNQPNGVAVANEQSKKSQDEYDGQNRMRERTAGWKHPERPRKRFIDHVRKLGADCECQY